MHKLIYAKIYPNRYALLANSIEPGKAIEHSIDKQDDFLERLFQECEYHPIPERIAASERYIELAKYYSAESETTVEITQGDGQIFVCYFFDFIVNFGYIKETLAELIRLSDSIDIYKSTDSEQNTLKLLLTFKTHDLYSSGKKVGLI